MEVKGEAAVFDQIHIRGRVVVFHLQIVDVGIADHPVQAEIYRVISAVRGLEAEIQPGPTAVDIRIRNIVQIFALMDAALGVRNLQINAVPGKGRDARGVDVGRDRVGFPHAEAADQMMGAVDRGHGSRRRRLEGAVSGTRQGVRRGRDGRPRGSIHRPFQIVARKLETAVWQKLHRGHPDPGASERAVVLLVRAACGGIDRVGRAKQLVGGRGGIGVDGPPKIVEETGRNNIVVCAFRAVVAPIGVDRLFSGNTGDRGSCAVLPARSGGRPGVFIVFADPVGGVILEIHHVIGDHIPHSADQGSRVFVAELNDLRFRRFAGSFSENLMKAVAAVCKMVFIACAVLNTAQPIPAGNRFVAEAHHRAVGFSVILDADMIQTGSCGGGRVGRGRIATVQEEDFDHVAVVIRHSGQEAVREDPDVALIVVHPVIAGRGRVFLDLQPEAVFVKVPDARAVLLQVLCEVMDRSVAVSVFDIGLRAAAFKLVLQIDLLQLLHDVQLHIPAHGKVITELA